MYSHLLVPLDGSTIAKDLTSQAIAYAAASGAGITFFHAVPDYGATSDGALQRTLEPDHFKQRGERESRQILDPALSAARSAGIACLGEWEISDIPYKAIQDAATRHKCDLIFIASHGKRGLDRVWLGSQTLKLVSTASLPVLVVRAKPA